MESIFNNQNWWEIFFGKDYLSICQYLYPKDKTKMECDFILNQLQINHNNKILDLACGQGRHTLELCRRGFQVSGVDASTILLNKAKAESQKKNLNPKFINADIRTFKTSFQFDSIVLLGNSFGYFNSVDNKKVIKNIAKSLKVKGKFLLDLPNASGLIRDINQETKIKFPTGSFSATNIAYDKKTSILTLKWTFVLENKSKSFYGKIKLYHLPDIKRILLKNDLKIIKTFGSFSGEPYTIDSPRLIIIVVKRVS